jgi:4-amino-4-deoxy-L-arabinose transferase-like glycosyltransferase
LSAIVVFVLVVAGLVLRLLYLRGHYFISADGAVFAAVGKHLLEWKGIVANGAPQPLILPLMPLLMGVTAKILGGLTPEKMELAGHLLSLCAGILAVIPLGLLARKWGGEVGMWTALGLYLLNARFLTQMTEVVPEPLFILFYSLAVAAAWSVLAKPRISMAFLVGVLIALSYLLRAEAFFFLPTFAVLLIIVYLVRRQGKVIPALVLALVLGWLIPSSPYLVWVHGISGKWQLSAKTEYNLQVISRVWGSDDPLVLERTLFGVDRVDVLAPSEKSGLSFILENRDEMVRLYLTNFIRMGRLKWQILKWWGVALFIVGVVGLVSQRGRRLPIALFFAAVVPAFTIPFFHVEERYVYAYFALAQVVAGCGAGVIADLLMNRIHRARTRDIAYVAAALIILAALGVHSKHAFKLAVSPGDLPVEHREMGLFIRGNLPDVGTAGGLALASRMPWVAFYADRENFQYLPFVDSVDELRAACGKFGIGWVVIDGRLVPRLNPSLAPLLDPSNAPPWLKLTVKLDTSPPILLYEIVQYGVVYGVVENPGPGNR